LPPPHAPGPRPGGVLLPRPPYAWKPAFERLPLLALRRRAWSEARQGCSAGSSRTAVRE
jgi:hypothetical protein